MTSTRKATAIGLLATAVMLVSCTSDDDGTNRATTVPGEVDVTAPEGYTVHRGDDYGFAFPFDWMPVPGGGTYADGAAVEIVGPSGDAGLPALISLYRADGFVGDFDRYLFTFNGESATALPDRVVIRDEAINIPQSAAARLIEAEYTLQGVQGLVSEVEEAEPDAKERPRAGKDERKRTGRGPNDNDRHRGDRSSAPSPPEPPEPPSVVIRQVDLLVLTPDGVTINLRAAAPSEDFDDFSEIFTTVINSLRVPAPVVGGG